MVICPKQLVSSSYNGPPKHIISCFTSKLCFSYLKKRNNKQTKTLTLEKHKPLTITSVTSLLNVLNKCNTTGNAHLIPFHHGLWFCLVQFPPHASRKYQADQSCFEVI